MEDDVGRVRDGMSTLHPLVDRALASVSAALSRDTRGAKGCVKEGADHRKKKTLPVNWLLKQNWLLSVWLSNNSQFTVKVFIRVHRSLASRLHAVSVSRSSARRLTAARLQND